MRMLRAGLVSVREAALIADVSRQRVREWCIAAGIDPAQARKAWLARILAQLEDAKPARGSVRHKR